MDTTRSATAPSARHLRPDPGGAGLGAAAILLVVVAFQLALALGAPWGRAAWGGTHRGVLPTELRVASVVSAGMNLALAAIAADRLARRRRRSALVGLVVFSAVGLVANSATRSPVERAIWAPVTAVLLVLSVLALRRERRRS